jgi:hypothetical protein
MKKKTAKPKARTSVKVKDLSPKKNPRGGSVQKGIQKGIQKTIISGF